MRDHPAIRYGAAVASVGVAVLVKFALSALVPVDLAPFALYVAAVMFAAWFGGFGPGLSAIVLSIACVLFLNPHDGATGPVNLDAWHIRVPVFLAESGFILLIAWQLRSAQKSALRSHLAEASAIRAHQVSQKLLHDLIRVGDIGICSGTLSGEITEANDKVLSMLGFPPTRLNSGPINWRDITPAQFDKADQRAIQQIQTLGRCDPFEKEFIKSDGARVPAMIFAARNHSTPDGFIAFIFDLSAQKQVEAELNLAQEAARTAQRVKIDFLANVNHELRTPLNAILGVNQLALQEDLPPDIRQYLTTTSDAAQELLALINDVLDFASMESGDFTLDSKTFDVRDTIRRLTRLLAPKAAQKELKLHTHIADALPDKVVGDPLRLRKILLNILQNAIKFTDQGEITLRVDSESIGQQRVRLTFSVQDTGVGVPDAVSRDIFDPFVQADTSTTRRHPGVGLGLAIADRLARRMNGRVWLADNANAGSQFFVSLELGVPDTRDTPNLHRGSDEESSAQRPINVLLAEDVRVNQMVIQKSLANRGHNVTIASNGREAIEIWRNSDVDVILMDIQMPVLDGLQATVAIRAIEQVQNRPVRTPVLGFTAHAMHADRQRCLDVGMDDYVSKPIDVRQVIEKVENMARAKKPPKTDQSPMATSPLYPRLINLEEALKRLGDDREILVATAEYFLEDAPTILNSLHEAVEAKDAQTARRAAHSLKGLAANFGAEPVVQAALYVEELAVNQEFDKLDVPLANLQQWIEKLYQQLRDFLSDRRI